MCEAANQAPYSLSSVQGPSRSSQEQKGCGPAQAAPDELSCGISVGNVFLLSPTTATYWCCIADGLALTVPNVALYNGEMPVNPAKGGGCNSVYDKQDLQ